MESTVNQADSGAQPGREARSGRVNWRRLGRGLALIGGPVFALALGYALSMGPAVRLAQRRQISTEMVEAVYQPLMIGCGILPGGEALLHWYVELWVEPGF